MFTEAAQRLCLFTKAEQGRLLMLLLLPETTAAIRSADREPHRGVQPVPLSTTYYLPSLFAEYYSSYVYPGCVVL